MFSILTELLSLPFLDKQIVLTVSGDRERGRLPGASPKSVPVGRGHAVIFVPGLEHGVPGAAPVVVAWVAGGARS